MPNFSSFLKHVNQHPPTDSHLQSLINHYCSYLQSLISKEEIEKLAKETLFIKRSSYRLSGYIFVLALLISSLDARYYSLEALCSLIRELDPSIDIQPQSLMERMNSPEAAIFLEAVEKRGLEKKIQKEFSNLPISILKPFKKLLLQDSTILNLHAKLQNFFKGSGGRASKSCLKIDLIFDLKANRFESTIIKDMKQTDQTLSREITKLVKEDCLIIRDLGYCNLDNLKNIQYKGGYFLSRCRSGLLIYLKENSEDPLDLVTYLAKHHPQDAMIDLDLYLTEKKFKVRMVIYRTPQEIADERKRKAHAIAKKQGRTLKKNTLELMNFTIFITNVSRDIWKPEVVGTVYRLRWTIELIFKNWKSEMNIHYLAGINPNRIRCLIFSKLLAVFIVNQIYQLAVLYAEKFLAKELSMNKTFKWLRNNSHIVSLLKNGLNSASGAFFLREISRTMVRAKRKRKSVLQMVQSGISFNESFKLV